MNNNKFAKPIFLPLALAAAVGLASQSASAAITLYDQDDTTFSVDGYFNTFYVNSKVKYRDQSGKKDHNRRQSRVKMGFLPNYIGFNFSKQVGELTLGGRSSFWVSINDSQTNGTESGIDVRQFYGTVASDWGEVLIGKDFGLFGRSNIFLDELLPGYGQASDSLGLVDGAGVSFGNIGTGYVYPFPTAQITYRSPVMSGFRAAVGILDPAHANREYDSNAAPGGKGNNDQIYKSYQKSPRIESELTYQFDVSDTKFYTWVNGTYQTSNNTNKDDNAPDRDALKKLKSKGVGYGVQVKHGGFSVTASGFNAKGVHPFFSNNAGKANLLNIKSRGHLLQTSYQFGANRVALSYGRTKDDGVVGVDKAAAQGANYKTRGIGYFRDINEHLSLVAEYNSFRWDGRRGNREDERTNTMAVGAVLKF